MNLTSNTAVSYPMGAGRFEPWLFSTATGSSWPRLEMSCTHLDKKLQYCSSNSCCINKRSYEPLHNHNVISNSSFSLTVMSLIKSLYNHPTINPSMPNNFHYSKHSCMSCS